MNQLAYGQKIKMPTGVVRSVSFDKIRSGSLSARGKPTQNAHQTKKSNYQDLLSKKLEHENKPKIKKQQQLNPHLEQIRKQLQQKQMKQCTFRPKINDNVTQKHRTFMDFVNQQNNYQKKKQDKVQEMRQIISAKLDKQNTFQPNIQNQHTNQYDQHVHDRLYQDWRKKTNKENSQANYSMEKSVCSKNKSKKKIQTYSRKGQSSTGSSVLKQKRYTQNRTPLMTENSKTLTVPNFTDRSAISRQNSEKSLKSQKGLKVTKYMNVQELCDMKTKTKIHDQIDKNNNKRTLKNKEIYIQKVLREISYVLVDTQITTKSLGYLQLTRILQKMNFINQQENVENRKYLFEIWQMLQGDVYETVPLINLIKLIFCLLGCHDRNLIQNSLKQYFTQQEMNDRILVLTQKDSKKIKANFQQLALFRFNKGEYLQGQPKQQQYTFKPYVSKNSTEMAQKYRKKVIQESQHLINQNLIEYPINQDGVVDHVDLLLLDQKRKQLKIKMKRQQYQRQKKRIQDEIMGYTKQNTDNIKQKNRTLVSSISQQMTQKYDSMPNSRVQNLYQMGKNLIRQKQQPIPVGQLPKQCTFHPNINKSRQNSKNISRDSSSVLVSHEDSNMLYQGSQKSYRGSSKEIKDYDKSVFRMYQARRMKQQNINKHHSSVMTRRNIDDSHYSGKDDDSPLLYLNVNMQGYDDVKVPIFKTDNMRTITHKVRVLMNIAQADQQKLQQILRLQILPALNQIGLDIHVLQ